MNPLDQKFDGCAPRRYVGRAHCAIERSLRCYGGGSSSSSTSQPVTNQQVGLETGAGAGIAVGAGSTTGAINIQTLDDAQLASLTTAAATSLAARTAWLVEPCATQIAQHRRTWSLHCWSSGHDWRADGAERSAATLQRCHDAGHHGAHDRPKRCAAGLAAARISRTAPIMSRQRT